MDWQAFLTDNQIEWVSRGPNTKRGEISIRCPWCGDEDPSQHLGISLTNENWGCLRDAAHRGHSATYLIGALLGCSQHQAQLVQRQYSSSDPDLLGALSLESDISQAAAEPASAEEVPVERIIEPEGSTARFWNYLLDRGFDDPGSLCKQYRLTACLIGRFSDRIIIPFYERDELVAWTGRALGHPRVAARYLSSKRVKEVIFNQDALMQGGDVLFVVEGPVDALKLDYYGQALGARATCALGTSLTIQQIVLLNSRRKRFKRTVILFDQDAFGQAYEAVDWVGQKDVSVGQLPDGVKDPGELNAGQIETLIKATT